jgi:hypothetical protein
VIDLNIFCNPLRVKKARLSSLARRPGKDRETHLELAAYGFGA